MTTSTTKKFYLTLKRRDGKIVGHEASLLTPSFPVEKEPDDEPSDDEEESPKEDGSSQKLSGNDFETVFKNFVSTIESFRRFMPLTLQIAPEITKAVAEREIAEFAEGHGVRRDDLSNESVEVYELDINFFNEFTVHHERVRSVAGGARLLPQVVIVGLVSAYDGFLASLLTAVIERHEEIVLTSQKQLTYKELLEFNSIADARTALIEREVEAVIRKSHHEQFEWMQHNLNVPLKKGLTVWPRFIELCERRNLFTHTNGVVSGQYLKVCC